MPLTEEQREELAVAEQERITDYKQWKAQCSANGHVIFAYRPMSSCRGRDCVPSKWDWRYDFDRERPMHGNAYKCITRADLREIMRRL